MKTGTFSEDGGGCGRRRKGSTLVGKCGEDGSGGKGRGAPLAPRTDWPHAGGRDNPDEFELSCSTLYDEFPSASVLVRFCGLLADGRDERRSGNVRY